MEFASVSWLGAVLAGAAFFAVGGLYYGPVFGKQWMAASGVTEEQARESNMPVIFGGTLVLEIIAAIGLAALIGADVTPVAGLVMGLAVAVLIVVPVLGVLGLYERKGITLWALNAGYNLIGFAVMGLVIGAFQ
jgi:hypothetical protein